MITIILPSYNCAEWIGEAILSVRYQTLANWQLLVMDDGSNDNSLDIARKIASEDSRIKVYASEHRGVAAIRNEGLAKAEGDYIAFIDADDIWPDYYLDLLLKIMEMFDTDIVSGKIVRFDDDKGSNLINRYNKKFADLYSGYEEDGKYKRIADRNCKVLHPEEAVAQSLYQRGVIASFMGKLYKRKLFDGLSFREGELYEDLDMFYRVALRSNKFVECSIPTYLYRQRRGSIVHTFNRHRLDVLAVSERLYDWISLNCPSLKDAALDRRFSANFNMLGLILKHKGDMESDSPYYEIKERECRDFVKANALSTLCNRRVRLKNKIGAMAILTLPSPILNFMLKKLI